MKKTLQKLLIFSNSIALVLPTLFVAILSLSSPVYASSTDGTIDPNNVGNQYAWSDNLGWINFGTGVGAGDIHITSAGITGYAWSDNYGWINMAPAGSGVTFSSGGNLTGSAWGENTGYIDFSTASIDDAGLFMGTATGTVAGTINFNCANCVVETDYRPNGGGGQQRHRSTVSTPSAAEEEIIEEVISTVPAEESALEQASESESEIEETHPAAGEFVPNLSDIDGDGVPNNMDTDIDGDGEENSTDLDVDGDALPNSIDPDIDGDGIANSEDPDIDGDMVVNLSDLDIDGDGTSNIYDEDDDQDNILDEEDSSPSGTGTQTDVDGDGIENGFDTDVDGDGIQNGEDTDVNGNGILNRKDRDLDSDGIPNTEDSDRGFQSSLHGAAGTSGRGSHRRLTCSDNLIDIADEAENEAIYQTVKLNYFLCLDNGYFTPNGLVTRADMVKLVSIGLGQSSEHSTGLKWYGKWLSFLLKEKIVKREVSPERYEPRADVLALIVKAKGINIETLPACISQPFMDVPSDAWFCPVIVKAIAEGWIDQESYWFNPFDLAKRSWTAGVIYRAFVL